MSSVGKHSIDTRRVEENQSFADSVDSHESAHLTKIDSTARQVLKENDLTGVLNASNEESTQTTETPPTSPLLTHTQVHRNQISPSIQRLDSCLEELVITAKTLSIIKIEKTAAKSSFDSKGEKIPAKKESERLHVLEQQDTRLSISKAKKGPLLKEKNLKALLKIEGKDVYVNLRGLADRLHLPLNELIKAAQSNRLERYLLEKTAHIKTLSTTLSIFKRVAKSYETAFEGIDPNCSLSKEQIIKVIQAAFLTPLKKGESHVFYLGFNGTELKRSQPDDLILYPLKPKTLVYQEPSGNITFFYEAKVLGKGKYGIVNQVVKFNLEASRVGVLKTNRRNFTDSSLSKEYAFHKKLREKLNGRKLPGIQAMPKPIVWLTPIKRTDSTDSIDVLESLEQSNSENIKVNSTQTNREKVVGLFTKKYNLGSLEDCLQNLTPQEKRSVFKQLLITFLEFELLKISHADLKTANILVERTNKGIKAYIGDFGESKFKEDIEDIQKPTPAYTFFPDFEERIMSKDIDDIYEICTSLDTLAMGCVFFKIFTGTDFSNLNGIQFGMLGFTFKKLSDLKNNDNQSFNEILNKMIKDGAFTDKEAIEVQKLIKIMLDPDRKKRTQWREQAQLVLKNILK